MLSSQIALLLPYHSLYCRQLCFSCNSILLISARSTEWTEGHKITAHLPLVHRFNPCPCSCYEKQTFSSNSSHRTGISCIHEDLSLLAVSHKEWKCKFWCLNWVLFYHFWSKLVGHHMEQASTEAACTWLVWCVKDGRFSLHQSSQLLYV